MTEERRRFQRITFDADCEVHTEECSWPVELIDISFQGALTSVILTPLLNIGDTAELIIRLSNDITIRMPVILRHQLGEYLGFEAQNMDIDSISHLRRLVELNLGDEALLERELKHLTNT
ncbi:PilZ domain-containing protein [Amphritea pacifica]|uniref:Cyclic diguanosine monophosphate-binding protein n=1 Tax=Amphritea pacifica TaxID=2811233 RepID=A0ABS2W3I6_9GAMM|nr:PilZ domain-containing protein [Amphritea pacifica]MBN0986274.1 PilZ domain-containing protein [Amphritea pacifica]MBN1006965.1 PilZ domain-containing protein [Amphritea pacifica]